MEECGKVLSKASLILRVVMATISCIYLTEDTHNIYSIVRTFSFMLYCSFWHHDLFLSYIELYRTVELLIICCLHLFNLSDCTAMSGFF